VPPEQHVRQPVHWWCPLCQCAAVKGVCSEKAMRSRAHSDTRGAGAQPKSVCAPLRTCVAVFVVASVTLVRSREASGIRVSGAQPR